MQNDISKPHALDYRRPHQQNDDPAEEQPDNGFRPDPTAVGLFFGFVGVGVTITMYILANILQLDLPGSLIVIGSGHAFFLTLTCAARKFLRCQGSIIGYSIGAVASVLLPFLIFAMFFGR